MASLYRKWRSRSFDDLVGQEHVVRTLRNAVRHHRVAHAYLFTGPRGTGKTSTARILAKAVNCLQPQDGNPCNQCEMCRAANDGRAMDVIEIDAASNTSVDNVRDLRETVAYAAGEGSFKVYIVDEVHRLSGAAFDAFLKTLEEPPDHVIFVFASTEPHKVPETITSRCQRFDFHRITSAVMLERMRYVSEQENISVTDDALRLVALHASGSLRDGLGLLDQAAAYTEGEIDDGAIRSALGLADAGLVGSLTDALLAGNVGEGLRQFHAFVDDGGDPRQLTRQLVEYWRVLLLVVTRAVHDEIPVDPALAELVEQHARAVGGRSVISVLHALVDQEFASKFNVPLSLPFELAYVEASLALQPGNRTSEGVNTRTPAAQSPADASLERRAAYSNIERPGDQYAKVFGIPAGPDQDGENAAKTGASGQGHDDRNTPATPVPASPAPLANGAGDIFSLWDVVVESMRARSPSVQALLRSGHLLKSQDGELTVGFFHTFHRNEASKPQKRKLVEEVVHEVIGATYRVNYVLTTREEVEALRGHGSVEEDDGFIEEVAERLRNYHARELENDRS